MDLGVTALLTDRSISPARLAHEAEARGFSSLFLPEHTHLPVEESTPPMVVDGVTADGYRRTLDPLVALAAAAATTTRLRLGTGILLVAQHDPIVLAKQIATLDHLSGGRVVFGVGYGWNEREMADHGVDPSRRRAIAHDKLRCIQALWSQDPAEYHGEFVDLPPCHAFPKPVQRPRPTIVFGGPPSDRLFEAIAELGDGWMPIGGAGVAASLARLSAAAEKAGRDAGSLSAIPFGTMPDKGKLEHFAAAGITEVVLRLPSAPADEMLAVLDDYAGFIAQVR